MKLNVKFILITFLIVVVISASSTVIFYSLAGKALFQQQSKSILNSTSDLVVALQNEVLKTDSDFSGLIPKLNNFYSLNLDSTSIDFMFTLVNDSLINASEFKTNSKSYVNSRSYSFHKFFINNPNVILRYSQLANGKTVYYGNLISPKMLDRISDKIRSEVALIVNDVPVDLSHSNQNETNLLSVVNAIRDLKHKIIYSIYTADSDNGDFIATLYSPKLYLSPSAKINFIVFDAFKESVDFRNTLRVVMMLIILAGSAVTFIVVFVSTAKLRKQIFLLSNAAEITSKGNMDHRVDVITHDEIGSLSIVFNRMLDELVRNKKAENEYSEFITLINQNPTLKEISDAALTKIIKTTGLTFGVLYLVDNKTLRLISSFGISRNLAGTTQNTDLYNNAVDKKEKIEFHFHEHFPEVQTGIAAIKIKYLTVYPILYNKETIAILELASESEPQYDVLKYLDNIQEQLAIGLANAKSLEQLENLVNELRRLNEEYQKQNTQITVQNEELKELHKQLREKADELENQRAKAVELAKVKSEFLASMSHELRTPLISILGLTDLLLKDSVVTSSIRERLKIVHRNGKKLLELISNILEFSKFDSGKIEIKKESFLLNNLFDEIYPNIYQMALEKNISFVFEIPSNTDVLVETDKTKLEQILLNLLVNSVKFTNEGSVTLTAKIVNDRDLILEVIDTGIGLSEENKKIIFMEFQQVDSSTSRKHGGTGLGLAICKKYTELLGGRIIVESEIGAGSKFTVILPNTVLDVIKNSKHTFLTISEPQQKERGNKTVVIVSDNFESQKFINDYLQSYDYKIFTSSNTADCLQIAKAKMPNVIVLNPFLKKENVWQLISKLKSDPATVSIPILLTMIMEEEKVGWESEIFDFVVNPLTLEDITAKVEQAENYFGRQIKKVALIDWNKEEYEILSNFKNCAFELFYISEVDNMINLIEKENPQLIILDLQSFGKNSLQISYELSQNKISKQIPVILKVPSEVSQKLSDDLTQQLKQMALKIKSHPLDVLKNIRERLKIDDSETNKKMNLIEETSEVQAVSKKFVGEDQSFNNTKATVLIVDDDSDALFTIGEYIKQLNCDTLFAHNGTECLLMLNHINPNLILLDIMMPQMDGFETIKRIRADSRFNNIPVIALTAYAMLDNKNVIEKNGFNDLITKPIDFQILTATFRKHLKKLAAEF